jgi:hypothetical protein
VIAHESAIEGWWEAIVLARDGDMLTLKWRDYDQPNVTRHVGSVALLMRLRSVSDHSSPKLGSCLAARAFSHQSPIRK